MKGYYLFAPVEPKVLGKDSGVERKVRAQVETINQVFECKLIVLPPVEYSGSILEKIIRRLPFTPAWRKWKYHGEFNDGNFLYVRQVYHDSSFKRYLRDIKTQNPGIKILYEIPTYPYDSEVQITIANAPFVAKERISRRMMATYIDRIVTFYGQKKIWGVPCINLINGYDFSQVKLPKRQLTDEIHIISVAQTAFWHGYDRFLSGLACYYKNGGEEKIVYHYVGNVMPEHKDFVANNQLENCVIFHGRQSGKALHELLSSSLIGIDVLGGHRKNYPVSSSLKSREYFAYGIPIITASPIDFLPIESEYQLLVPYDDSPVNIDSVLSYYHRLYDNKECNEVAKEVRNYAENRCDIKKTIKPVEDWILGN